jgi:arsenate reductase (glutaredoxin)
MTTRVILWHNPRCSKSRRALAALEEAHAVVDLRRYLDDPPTAAELRDVLRKLGSPAGDLVRRGEPVFAELGLEQAGDEALVDAMARHPILIERPIAIVGERAVVGRPPERVMALIRGDV